MLFVSAGAAIGYYIGGFDGFLRVLVAFTVLDYITALALAIKEKKLSSDVGFFGIFKKVLIFAMVAVANLIDIEIASTGDLLRNAIVFFYLSNEGLSLLENCAALGLHIPETIRVTLLKIRNNKEENNVVAVVPATEAVLISKSDAPPVIISSDGAVMTKAMYEELTDGRCAGGKLEQSACGIPANKPKQK